MSGFERAKTGLSGGTRPEAEGRRRKGPVRIAVRVLLAIFLLAVAAGIAGFLHFAETVAARVAPRAPKAGAIVGFSGG